MLCARLTRKGLVRLLKTFALLVRKSRFILLALSLIAFAYHSTSFPLPTEGDPIRFYSTHQLDDLRLITLEAIKRAKHSIYIYTYALTDPVILSALTKKARAGLLVDVTYHQKNTPKLKNLKQMHLHPKKGAGLMHAKWMIIDESFVLLGTANLTTPSLIMHENFLMGIYDQGFAKALKNPSYYHKKMGEQMVTFYLLPDKRALDYLLATLDQSVEKVRVALFTFTHPLLIQKLVDLKKLKVQVEVTLDRFNASGASKKAAQTLFQEGIPLKTNQGLPLFHHKCALIDQSVFVIGSANWTKAAFQKNQDFILFLSPLNKKQYKKIKKTFDLITKYSFHYN